MTKITGRLKSYKILKNPINSNSKKKTPKTPPQYFNVFLRNLTKKGHQSIRKSELMFFFVFKIGHT